MIIKYCDFKDGIYYQMTKGQRVPLEPQPGADEIMIYRRYYSNLKRNPDFKRRMTMIIKFPGKLTPKYDVYIAEYIGAMTGPPQLHGNSRGALLLPHVALTPLPKALYPNPAPLPSGKNIFATTATATRKKRKTKTRTFGDDWVMDSSFGSASKQQIVKRARSRGGKRLRQTDDTEYAEDGGGMDEFDNVEEGNDSAMSSEAEVEESIVSVTRPEPSNPLLSGSKIAYRLLQGDMSTYKLASLTGRSRGGEQNAAGRNKSEPNQDPVSVFSPAEEDALFRHIVQVRDCGYTLTRKQLLETFEETSLFYGRRQTGKPLTKRFLSYFLEKHPQFKADVVDIAKAKGRRSKMEVQLEYFRQLNEAIDELGLWEKPQLIFALEKTQLSLEEASEGSSMVPEVKSSATLLTCVSATGQPIPPFIVFKGSHMSDDVLEEALPGTEAVVCEKGLNSSVLQDFLESHLTQHHPSPGESNILILFEGTLCQLTAPLLRWARERNMIFFPLPPHRSQLTEDQDTSCFSMFRKSWDSVFQEFASNNSTTCLSQRDLCSLICKAYSEALSVRSVVGFFKQTGVFPFMPKYVANVRRGSTVQLMVVPCNR